MASNFQTGEKETWPHGSLTLANLWFYANDRLVSLRNTRLVKIAERGGSVPHRLIGLSHVTSARSMVVFAKALAGGWAATTWERR